MAASSELETDYLHLHSAIGLTTNDLRKRLLKLAVALNSGRLGLLIVDALELIRPDMLHHGERAWDAGTTLHHLKFIAQEFQLPVMVLTKFSCSANTSDACKPSFLSSTLPIKFRPLRRAVRQSNQQLRRVFGLNS
jgi:replicative DNA helicase